MKTELLSIFAIAQRIASIAEGEIKENLAVEIVKLTLYLQSKKPVYVMYCKKEKLIFITMSKIVSTYESVYEYKLLLTIEESKELNKYKVTSI